jgi:hypothetical protein
VIPRRAALILLFAVVLAGLGLSGPADAQQRVRFEGRLLWLSGDTMAVAVNDGPSVSIDLSKVPQSDYQGLEEGEWVMVLAEYSRDRRELYGLSVTRYSGFQSP